MNKWRLYYLPLHGHLIVVKSILLAQYIYIGTVMDIMSEEGMINLQTTLNQFVAYNEVVRCSRSTWISNGIMYTPTREWGLI